MICPRCRRGMQELRGTHHKRRKWKCRRCGRVRMARRTRRKQVPAPEG